MKYVVGNLGGVTKLLGLWCKDSEYWPRTQKSMILYFTELGYTNVEILNHFPRGLS